MNFKIFTFLLLGMWLTHTSIQAQTDLSNLCGDIDATTTLLINECDNALFRVPTTNTLSAVPLAPCSNVASANLRDGWAGFTSLASGDSRVVVQYNHIVSPFAPQALTVYDDCASAEVGTQINANTEGNFDVNFIITPTNPLLINFSGVSVDAYREGWVRYTAQIGEKFTVSYTNTNQDAAIAVYQNGCPGTGSFMALRNAVGGAGLEEVTLTNNTGAIATYEIRIMNVQSNNPMNGTLRVRQHNAMLAVYQGTCATPVLLGCSVSGTEGTQIVTFNADPSTDYYVRIVNLFSNADMDGNLCVFNGPAQSGDLCSEAQEVSIGTCDYQLEVFSSFFNNENLAIPPACGITDVFRDGWARFVVTEANQRIGVEYQSEDTDVALAIYTGNCNGLNYLTCANQELTTNGSPQKEFIEFTAPAIGTYYVRIMNIESTQTMVGKLCIYNVIPRDNCADAVASAQTLVLGDCNVKANISTTSGASGNACGVDNNDIWIRYDHTDASVSSVRVEYVADKDEFTHNPSLAVYNGATLNCADLSTPAPVVCITANLNSNTVSSSFNVVAGQTYYVRLSNQVSNEMTGKICIYDNGKRAEDNFFTALEFLIDGTDCGKQFNILSTFNGTGGLPANNPQTISCSSDLVLRDAWAKFQTGGTLPTNDLVIEYDNDNQDATFNNDVALLVYRGANITNTPATAAIIAPDQPSITTPMNLDTFYEGIDILQGDAVWAELNITTAGTYSLVFDTNPDTEIFIYDNMVSFMGNINNNLGGLEQGTFDFPVGTFYIQIQNSDFTDNIVGGRFAVLSPLTQVACSNGIDEGTEFVTLNGLVAGFQVNSTYYIRVANVQNPTSTTGKLCLRDGGVRPEDLCSTARPIISGDCDIEFNLIEANLPANQPIAPSCIGAKTLRSDAWASFTASASLTTFEYYKPNTAGNAGRDVAFEIYRGSCSGLILVACVDNLNGTPEEVETTNFNTLVGATYYIRIMNVGTAGDMEGRLCLFNTRERDVCDDQDIITLTPDACNVRFNVPATFSNTGAATNALGSCSTIDFGLLPGSRDAWVRFLGNGRTMTIQYQNEEATSNPMLMIYAPLNGPGPINCGVGIHGAGNPLNEYRCANDITTTGRQTESVSFPTQAGRLYILRVVDLAPNDMKGSLCIFSGQTGPEDCASATEISILSTLGNPDDVGACNVQFNVLDRNNLGANPPIDGDCPLTGYGEAWATFTTGLGGIFPLPGSNITIEYDNYNNSYTFAPDVSIEIFRANTIGGFDCTDPTTYTRVTPAPACSDAGIELTERVNFTVDVNNSEQYYIRIINKDDTRTAFGKLCIFYGETIARPNCASTLDYGPLDGSYKGFEVLSGWTDVSPQDRILDPVCIIPNGSNPTSPNPPIVSNGWVRFNVPVNINPDEQVTAVSIQFDNTRFSSSDINSENGAIAVYRLLPPNTPASINGNASACNLTNLQLIDCANNVWRGTETVTIGVEPGADYLVRVMNVRNKGRNMPGLVRIFEFASCELQGELVIDGTFENWRPLDISANPSPTTFLGATGLDNWVHSNPDIRKYTLTGTDMDRDIDYFSRFATDYGYLRDRAGGSGGDANSQRRLVASQGEFGPEGLYAISHNTYNYKNNWFCYGNGHTGYGGGSPWSFTASYCAAGGLGDGSEACIDFGTLEAGRPAIIPSAAEANFMTVNGWWKKPADYPNQEAGKIWCQTLDISGNASQPNRYYVFTAWFNNVKSIKQSGDVPQLRITVCDMEDVNNPGVLPLAAATGNTPSSILPGTTYTDDGVRTRHVPPPPNNANMRKAAPLGFAFGAAMPCNIDGEAPNSRLKGLGSDFFLPQEPDQWQVVRCIYRAPQNVTELNLCIENLSLSKGGNDFAIDDISFQQCSSTNTDALDALLRGDACELADEPTALGISLNMRMLDFTGRLVSNRTLLNWLVLNEQNLATYEVQRSTDGTNFYAIGEAEAKGSLNELQNYDFIDYNLPEGKSVIYYRLRMIDVNGRDRLGSVIQVGIDAINTLEMKLFPNPIQAGDDFSLGFQSFGGFANIKISDMMGNLKMNTLMPTQEGENIAKFSSKGLTSGMYIVHLRIGNQQVSRKLIVM